MQIKRRHLWCLFCLINFTAAITNTWFMYLVGKFRHMRFAFLLSFFLVCTLQLSAQRFGGNPSRQRWKQIVTDTVRVVFPEGNEKQAQKIAKIIHGLQQNNFNSLGSATRRVSMVLQHRSLFSNAYVGLAPFRSEFYTTAPQNAFELGGFDWVSTLAIHEYRHVQQYSNFKKGLSKLASVILGEEGQAVANAASIPDWFFEGDAVYNETLLTEQGRGKLPEFFNGYQSLYRAGKQYSYMKLRNGSLRDFVPNHYDLGYLLVAYGRKQYGNDIWQKITDDAARFKPLIYPFQGAVKKHTGISFDRFVNEALGYYRSQWKVSDTEEPNWITNIEKNNVLNYRFPYLMEDGTLLTLQNSNSQVPAFTKVSGDGKTERIRVRDIAIDPYFTYKNNKIVYTSYQPDARWGNVETNTLKIFDLTTQTEQVIKTGTRLFSPDISSDIQKILAVDMHTNGGSSMIKVEVVTGNTDTLFSDYDKVFSYPRFGKNDDGFYAVYRQTNGHMGISWYNSSGMNEKIMLPAANRVIGYLQVQGDTLLFTNTYQGRDELWSLIDDGTIVKGPFRLASYPTGIYQAVLSNGKLVGSVFTADGFRLASFVPKWEVAPVEHTMQPLYTGNSISSAGFGFSEKLKTRDFNVSPYKKTTRLVNIHSWRPYYDRPEYSFTLYGENVLNTFLTELAYTYNENEQSHKLSADFAYGGSYIQRIFGASSTYNRSGRLNQDTVLHWNEQTAYAGFRLPLNFTSGREYRNLSFQATINANQVGWTGIAKTLLKDRAVNYLDFNFSYSAQSQRALKQIFPRWGRVFSTRYRTAVGKTNAWQMLVSGAIYLPGFASTHNLVLTGAIQSRDTLNQYVFSDNFPFSRGYRSVNFPRAYKIGVNYHFPLLYPDWGFGQLVYFQRVRMNVFYDQSVGKSLRTGRKFHFGTVGGEMMFDTKWWNQEPVSFGLRYSRLLDYEFNGPTAVNYWEIILPVALFR
jgi:hypothetical protein